MTAPDHNRMLGIFHLIHGGIQTLAIFIALGLPSVAPEAWVEQPGFRFAVFVLRLAGLVLVAEATLSFSAGIGVLKRRPWARIVALIAGVLSLLSFPLGTALGIYTLWFLLGDAGSQLYLPAVSDAWRAPKP